MAHAAPLSTAERVRRAAYDALAAADGLEVADRTTSRHDQLVDVVERAAIELRTAVRGPGAAARG
jgi:hypothetical protein